MSFYTLFLFFMLHVFTVKSSNISVRLVSPYQGVDFLGRVEVFHENQWGTVCDSYYYFGTDEADIVCGMLNHAGSVCVVRWGGFGYGTGTLLAR